MGQIPIEVYAALIVTHLMALTFGVLIGRRLKVGPVLEVFDGFWNDPKALKRRAQRLEDKANGRR